MDQLIETTFSTGLEVGSPTPLQEQLHIKLRGIILAGTFPAGTRLPSTRQLATLLHVSRNTVLAAYDQLIAEGYLETKQGAGTFVSSHLPETFGAAPKTEQPQKPIITPNANHHNSLRSELGMRSGAPALDQFPKNIWARMTSKAWRTAGQNILSHDDLAGYAPLRRAITKYLQASRNIIATPDQVLIFSGLQQGLKLAAESLLSPDAAVIFENPGYTGFFRAAKTLAQRTLFTPVDKHGAITPTAYGQNMLVISPSRQFPLGYTMPLSRRLEILAWAERTNSLILEDDYDSEFRYSGRPLSSMQSIDGGKRVIYGGTFSKSIFPALRLGYLVLPAHLVNRVTMQRAATDSYPSIVPQIALSVFMEEGHFAKHIRKLRKTHARRQQVFIEAFHKHLNHLLTLEPSDTGLHMVARPRAVLSNMNDTALTDIAQTIGIGVTALSKTYAQPSCQTKPEQGILLGFANQQDTLIDQSLEKFAQSIKKAINFKETDF